MPNLVGFLSFVLLTAFTPGPNNIMAMSLAGKYGLREGLRFCLGTFLGSMLVIGCCALFTATLYSFIPRIEPLMLAIGAAYILWLAWNVLRDKSNMNDAILLRVDSLRTGMTLPLVNVKGFFYGITAFSSFIMPFSDSLPVLACFVLLLAGVIYAATACWAFSGALFQRAFTRHGKALNVIMALLLVYCAGTLLIPLYYWVAAHAA